ncbi:MAG: outer membrane lipoprotein carrier protein LolA [Syntrophaceae bacterium]|nr:outer membrane lipoprotein carrier protein LolA [Syntrophaceae bacterium]
MTKVFFKINKLFTPAEIVLFLILSLLALPACVFPEELQSVDDVVQKLQSTYEKTKDLKADFIQETAIKSIKKTEKEEGIVFFKNPKNMSWNYSKPQGKKLVINSRKAWLYLPQEKAVYVQKSESIFQSKFLINFFSGTGKLQNDFLIKYAESGALDEDGNYMLKLIPKEKTVACNSVQMTIDKKNFYILLVGFDDALGNSTTLKFSNIDINTGLTEKLFQFKPPKGVQVFEMP